MLEVNTHIPTIRTPQLSFVILFLPHYSYIIIVSFHSPLLSCPPLLVAAWLASGHAAPSSLCTALQSPWKIWKESSDAHIICSTNPSSEWIVTPLRSMYIREEQASSQSFCPLDLRPLAWSLLTLREATIRENHHEESHTPTPWTRPCCVAVHVACCQKNASIEICPSWY